MMVEKRRKEIKLLVLQKNRQQSEIISDKGKEAGESQRSSETVGGVEDIEGGGGC